MKRCRISFGSVPLRRTRIITGDPFYTMLSGEVSWKLHQIRTTADVRIELDTVGLSVVRGSFDVDV